MPCSKSEKIFSVVKIYLLGLSVDLRANVIKGVSIYMLCNRVATAWKSLGISDNFWKSHGICLSSHGKIIESHGTFVLIKKCKNVQFKHNLKASGEVILSLMLFVCYLV